MAGTLSSAHLEQYLDSVESLPHDLQRNFTLLRELDSRSQEIIKGIEGRAQGLLKQLRAMPLDQRTKAMRQLQQDFQKCLEYGDDKVHLAAQTYDMVDKHIRRLDDDLAKEEAVSRDEEPVPEERPRKKHRTADSDATPVANDRSTNANAQNNNSNNSSNNGSSASRDRRESREAPRSDKKAGAAVAASAAAPVSVKRERSAGNLNTSADRRSLTTTAVAVAAPKSSGKGRGMDIEMDMPVDPNEPTYCICHQVSYGEMIGCDNNDCPTEWFHFQCVGLASKPKGKWFCPRCADAKKREARR